MVDPLPGVNESPPVEYAMVQSQRVYIHILPPHLICSWTKPTHIFGSSGTKMLRTACISEDDFLIDVGNSHSVSVYYQSETILVASREQILCAQ